MAQYGGLSLISNGYSEFGRSFSFARAGDMNGDGFEDFIFALPDAANYGSYTSTGRAYVIYGNGNFPTSFDVATIDGTNGFEITNADFRINNAYSSFGFGAYAESIGDINGDGFDDVVILGRTQQYDYNNAEPNARFNTAFVVFGAASANASSTVNDIDGSNGFEIQGISGFINGVSAGDIDGDGVQDIVISQQPADNQVYGGYAAVAAEGDLAANNLYTSTSAYTGFVIFGDANLGATGAFDVNDLDGTNGFGVQSEFGDINTGYGGGYYGSDNGPQSFLGVAGDIDGDGFDDLAGLTTVPSIDAGAIGGTAFTHTQFLIRGGQTFTASFDPRTSGLVELVNVPPLNGISDGGSESSFAALGDINGDGYDDIAVSYSNLTAVGAIGDPDRIEFENGVVYVLFGGPEFVDRDGAGPDLGIPANVFTWGPPQGSGFLLYDTGASDGRRFGEFISSAGDVNNDGFDDFLVGLPENGFGFGLAEGGEAGVNAVAAGVNTGFVYLVLGQADFSALGALTTIISQTTQTVDIEALSQAELDPFIYRIDGVNQGDRFGQVVSAVGDVDGDGFDDIGISGGGRNFYGEVGVGASTSVILFGGTDALEAVDAADGSNDNVLNVGNIGVNVVTGVLPIQVSLQGAGTVAVFQSEGNPGDASLNAAGFTEFVFVAQRTGDLTETVSFDFAVAGTTSNGAAADDFRDGVFPTGTVVFAAGEATADIIIEVNPDLTIESTDIFSVTISNPVVTGGGTPISVTADESFGYIFNDDQPTFIFAGTQGAVLEDGPDNLVFTITRTGDTSSTVNVDYDISSAGLFHPLAADDFTFLQPSTGTVTFLAGETVKTIELDPIADNFIEATEGIRMTLSNVNSPDAQELDLFRSTATGYITNDDFPPQIVVSGGGNFFEGDSGFTDVTFTITRRGDLSGTLDVAYDLTPFPFAGNFLAADSGDILGNLPDSGVASFADGQATVDVIVQITGDTQIEPRESFELQATSFTSSDGIDYQFFNTRSRATIRNDDGRPPVIPPGVEADVFGDPHIVTLDGLGYDFQSVGEYILVETIDAADPNGFQVQARFEPLDGSDLVSVTTRMAVQVGGKTIEVDASSDDFLFVDGVALTAEQIALGAIDIDGVAGSAPDIFITGNMVTIVLNALGEQLQIKVNDGSLNICVFLDASHQGAVRGLMGDADGTGAATDRDDDLALRDGSQIFDPETITFEELYGVYASSWNLDGTGDKNALFTDGRAVAQRADFPAALISLDDLPQEIADAAMQAAIDAFNDAGKPLDPILLNAAALDFALTGNSDFLDGAVGLAANPQAVVDAGGAPDLPATVGISSTSSSIVEDNSGTQTIIFNLYRIGDTVGEVTVDYTIGGDVDAADLAAGTSLTGTVTFADGISTASILIAVAGDLANEADEDLSVNLSNISVAGGLIASASATTVVVNDDLGPNAVDDAFSSDAITAIVGNLLVANPNDADSDPEGDAISVASVTLPGGTVISTPDVDVVLPSGATFSFSANGDFTFTPSSTGSISDFDALGLGEVLSETFDYTLVDTNGGEDTGAVSLTIAGVNDAPVADDGALSAVANGPVVIGTATATDIDVNDTLTFSLFLSTGAGNGIAIVNADGSFSFNPGADFQGLAAGASRNVTFTFEVTDGIVSDIGDIVVTVNGANQAPTAIADGGVLGDAFTTSEATSFTTGNVLTNDTDPENDALRVLSFDTAGTLGTVSSNGDGTFDYNPGGAFTALAAGETATDTFSYMVTDDKGGADEATVTITITGVDNGGGEFVELIGTEERDTIIGGNDNELIIGLGGSDSLNGKGGDDSVLGGAGADTVRGQDGDDTVRGGTDNDIVRGGIGADLLFGDDGDDNVRGGLGNDTMDGGLGNDQMLGDAGDDLMTDLSGDNRLKGNAGNDTITAGDGEDTIRGGVGDDLINAGGGNDIISGESGNDTIFAGAGDDNVNGSTGMDQIMGEAGNDRLEGGQDADFIDGGTGTDSLIGLAGDDTLLAGEGDDRINGGVGNDLLDGGSENDVLRAGRGDDTLIGGTGNDTLNSGNGNDTFAFTAGFGADVIEDFDRWGNDVLQFEGLGPDFDTAQEFIDAAVAVDAMTVLIDLGGGNSLTLERTTLDSLTLDDFVVAEEFVL